jgi:4-carboxymuconolactone decarboxylase
MDNPLGQPKPRILPLPREEWTDGSRDVFEFWGEPNAREEGSKTNVIMVMANHTELATVYNIFGKHFAIESSLPGRPRELVVLRVAWRVKSLYEWHNHVGYALNLDMSLDEIAAIRIGHEAPNWNFEDRMVLKAVDELMDNNNLSDATWAELSTFLDRKAIMDLVFTVGQYVMVSWGLNAFGVQLESYADPIGFDLVTASGKNPGKTERPGESEDWAEKRGYSE